MKNFSMILAIDEENGIWKWWTLPWKIKKDMQYFQKTTVETQKPDSINALIMWRKTWESIPEKYRPLPWRINCILTRNKDYEAEWASVFHDFDTCLKEISSIETIENIFLIWGSYLYNSFLSHGNLEKIYITHVEWKYWCDVFFDGIPNTFKLHTMSSKQTENDRDYFFATYIK